MIASTLLSLTALATAALAAPVQERATACSAYSEHLSWPYLPVPTVF